MNRFARLLHTIDERVDKRNDRLMSFVSHYFPVVSATILGSLLLLFVHQIVSERPFLYTAIIQTDLERISRSLNAIDSSCSITDITTDRLPITFLNVEKFTGKELGGLVLGHPELWHGPYAHENPMLQTHPYELVKGEDGYYIVPGAGVQLPNGKKMGVDVVISVQTDVASLTKEGGVLNYQGYLLARPLLLGQEEKPVVTERADHLNDMIKEFSDALPYAYNGTVPQQVVAASMDRHGVRGS